MSISMAVLLGVVFGFVLAYGGFAIIYVLAYGLPQRTTNNPRYRNIMEHSNSLPIQIARMSIGSVKKKRG